MVGASKMIVLLLVASANLVFVSGQEEEKSFVEEIACTSGGMVVQLNKSEAGLATWMKDPAAQPVVYVYGFKDRPRCGIALKGVNGLALYNLSIPYGPSCGVKLSNIEPNHQTAETTIALEDNNDPRPSKAMRIHHVFCLYTRRVQAMKIKTISRGHQVVASKGGRPKPKVSIVFKTKDGKPIKAAKFGDEINFQLQIDPDSAYKAIAPRKCMFTDKENMADTRAQKLTFVESHCPVAGLADLISPLEDRDEEVYTSAFRTFRFGNESTLYAHCSVEVCLSRDSCRKTCFRRSPVVTATPATVTTINANVSRQRDFPGRLRKANLDTLRFTQRRRQRREAPGAETEELSLSQPLTILHSDEEAPVWEAPPSRPLEGLVERFLEEQAEETDPRLCLVSSAWSPAHSLLLSLGLALLVTTTTAICLANKLRKQTKDLEARALVTASPSSSAYQGPMGSTLGRRFGQPQGSAELFVDDSASLPDSNRSMCEITVGNTRHAWPDHSIPRVGQASHKPYYY